jgi:hypothetical protein
MDNVGMSYGRLETTYYGHLETTFFGHLVTTYILRPFGKFLVRWYQHMYIFQKFGTLYEEKSGIP